MQKFGQKLRLNWWDGQYVGDLFSLDTETELIKHDGHIPRLVLSSAYCKGKEIYLIKNDDISRFLEQHKSCTLVFHNAAFDLKVLTQHTGFDFHAQIMKDKILDTAILYRLVSLADRGLEAFRYSLDHCVKQMYQVELPKDDDIRLTFGQYLANNNSVDYDEISKAHLEYAGLDPVATMKVYEKIQKKITKEIPTSNRCGHQIHLMGDIALDRIRNYGIGVDLEYVNNLRAGWDGQMDAIGKVLASYGLVRGLKGFQSKYEEIMEFLEIDLPKSPKTGKLSMKAEDLAPHRQQPFVDALLSFLELEKLKAFLNELTASRVYPRYGSIKKTGRTSCSKPNIQNPPKKGGVREAFVPKPGHKFIDIDYSSIELYALAQTLKNFFGHSVLFDKLSRGEDVHIYAASQIFDKTEAEVTPEERQIAKICNYGLAANMSPETFQKHMAKQGAHLELKETRRVKEAWKKAFPEIQNFWRRGYGRQMFVSKTGFVRNNCSYTQYLNLHFQSVVAEGCKIALYFVQRAGYDIVAFVHDAIVVEIEAEKADEHMPIIQEIMVSSMQQIIPDLKIKTDGIIRDRYGK